MERRTFQKLMAGALIGSPGAMEGFSETDNGEVREVNPLSYAIDVDETLDWEKCVDLGDSGIVEVTVQYLSEGWGATQLSVDGEPSEDITRSIEETTFETYTVVNSGQTSIGIDFSEPGEYKVGFSGFAFDQA